MAKDTKERILSKVLELFSQKGYDGTNIKEWTQVFSSWYTVERMEHFAWPGESEETRRPFWL